MLSIRGRKNPPKRVIRHQRRVQDEFVAIDWDLIKNLDDTATVSEASTDLHVPSIYCLDDRTVGEEKMLNMI